MGPEALAASNELDSRSRARWSSAWRDPAAHRQTAALYVPNIDESLDEQDSKRAFWAAFRALGEWHAAQPPY